MIFPSLLWGGNVLPQGIAIDGFSVDNGTATFTIVSDSLIDGVVLSIHSPDPVLFIDCELDGINMEALVELDPQGSVFDNLFSTRFIVEGEFNNLVLRLSCLNTILEYSWFGGLPIFGYSGIVSPQNINWRDR